MRPGGDPARRAPGRDRDAGRDASPVRAVGRGRVRDQPRRTCRGAGGNGHRDCRQPGAMPGHRPGPAAACGPGRIRCASPDHAGSPRWRNCSWPTTGLAEPRPRRPPMPRDSRAAAAHGGWRDADGAGGSPGQPPRGEPCSAAISPTRRCSTPPPTPRRRSREKVALTFGANAGLTALLGQGQQLATVAGFTAWRAMGVLVPVGAVWAMLAATRLTRGEEDAGRTELLLAGQTTRRRAAAQAIAGHRRRAGAGVGHHRDRCCARRVLGQGGHPGGRRAVPGHRRDHRPGHVRRRGRAGRPAGGKPPASQRHHRRDPRRVAADPHRGRLQPRPALARWLSPLGWAEQLHPLTSPAPMVFLPIAAFTAVLAAGAIRWLGAGTSGLA